MGTMTARQSNPRDKHHTTILKAAEQEFAQHGLNGARMHAIANRAGLPKANVHYYFKNKDGLYLAVLDNIMASWNVYFNDVSVEDDPASALDRFIREKIKLSFEQPTASRLFANEMLHGAPYLSDYLKQVMRPWVNERAQIIQSWIDEGKMRSTDPVLLIYMIWATTQHYADFQVQVLSILDQPAYNAELKDKIADFLSSTILTGLGLRAKQI
jgi:TetR/AcrR family transcriptional regulator